MLAFTLLELLLVVGTAAFILLGVYGFFHKAIKTRDNADERIGDMRLRERAEGVIRNDLRNLYLSGGTFANVLEGGQTNSDSNFPGELQFTATTGRNPEKEGDVQRISYYISDTAESATLEHGPLVRAVVRVRDMVPPFTGEQELKEEVLLPKVRQFEVAFYDGANWQESWQYSDGNLPQAIRLRIIQDEASAPLEIYTIVTAQAP